MWLAIFIREAEFCAFSGKPGPPKIKEGRIIRLKRILVAAMHHESNSFNPIVTSEKDFKVMKGKEVFDHFRGNDSVTGVLKPLLDQGYEVIPTVFARAVPNGEVEYDFYMGIKDEIIRMAREEAEKAPIDAITLSLHGSMRVKNLGEAEGYLLEDLRNLFPHIPIFSALDMHTTMTQKMHDNCDGFVGYKCAPHTDCTETGEHAARMTILALEQGIEAKSAWVKVPILIAGEQSATNVEPMVTLIQELCETEKKPGILAASYLMGFPWADNEDSAVAVYVVAENQALAESEAIRLAEFIWSKKKEFCFQTEAYDEAKALDVAFEAAKNGETPLYLSDSGDNPTAGSSSDCTDFLRRLMADERTKDLRRPVLYGGIYDPAATKACEGKVGQELTLTFGAKFDTVTTSPITATGTVKAYIKDWGGFSTITSDLALFHSQGVDIVLAEKHVGYVHPNLYRDLGADPAEADLVVCKLGYLTEHHEEVAKRAILVLTKGSTNEDLKTLPYEKTPRPIFPLDNEFAYCAKEQLVKKAR